MLVLARKPGESIRIGDDIVITVLPGYEDRGREIRLGISAPREMTILREELLYRDDMDRRFKRH